MPLPCSGGGDGVGAESPCGAVEGMGVGAGSAVGAKVGSTMGVPGAMPVL